MKSKGFFGEHPDYGDRRRNIERRTGDRRLKQPDRRRWIPGRGRKARGK